MHRRLPSGPLWRSLAMLLGLALVGGSCGGSDSTSRTEGFAPPVTAFSEPSVATSTVDDEAAFEESLVTGILSAAPGPILGSEDTARCAASAATAAIGVEALTRAGAPGRFDFAALSAEDQDLLVEALGSCIDVATLLTDSEAAGIALASESAACVAEQVEQTGLGADILRAGLAAMDLQIPEDEAVRLLEALTACLDPDEIATLLSLLGVGSL